MSEAAYRYVALDPLRGRVTGTISAASEPEAYARLRQQGLSPLRLSGGGVGGGKQPGRLSRRDALGLLSELAALLKAGSDIRTSLRILSSRPGGRPAAVIARQLAEDVAGGEALEASLLRRLGPAYEFAAALTAAGEARGAAGEGLQRAAQVLERRLAVRDQLAAALSYPLFVTATALAAFLVILLLVVPALAPLIEELDPDTLSPLVILNTVSSFILDNGWSLLIASGLAGGGLFAAASTGLLRGPLERLLLDGPMGRTARSLIFGGFATDLGGVLASGAAIGEALRLSIRTVSLGLARQRLAPIPAAVREGERLSTAIGQVPGMPEGVAALAEIGEETGQLGALLEQAGRLEEARALKRIDAMGKLLGPIMIVVLGGLVGLLMAGLLSGVSSLGAEALE
jgi:general secretion pathway protein F